MSGKRVWGVAGRGVTRRGVCRVWPLCVAGDGQEMGRRWRQEVHMCVWDVAVE